MEKSKVCEEYDLRIYDGDYKNDVAAWLRCMTALQVYGC